MSEVEINQKLDKVLDSLARIEERVKTQKETTDKLEKDVESLNRDTNKGKGALALIGLAGTVLALKSFFFR